MSAKTSPLLLKIKKEVNEEIKEYAESAMNELLGWYGYCNSTNDHSTERFNHLTSARMSTPNFATILSQSTTYSNTKHISSTSQTAASKRKRENSLSLDEIDNTTDSMSANDEMTKVSPQISKDATINVITNSEKSPTPSHSDECGWCKRIIPFGTSEFSATPEGLKYCSESCFTQSRRASYKRAKTCDWCKHIRHAVSYVDFQDGASQLQFCSDKCLNQYKMQIFCKETQAHLDLNPHLKTKGKTLNENLITPDLWMRNCRSRSMTPDQRSNDSRGTESPITNTLGTNQMPTIKVASVSKLLSCEHESKKSTPQCQQMDEPTSISDLKNYSHFTQKTRTLRKRRTNRLSSSSNSVSASGNMSECSNNNDSSNENRNMHANVYTVNMMGDKNRLNNLMQPSLMPGLQPPKISPSTGKNTPIDEPSAAFMQRYQLLPQQKPNIFRMNESRSLQNALRQSAQFIAPLIPNHGYSDGPSPEMMSKMPQMSPFSKLSPMNRQRPEPAPSMTSARKPIFEPENHHMFMLQQQQKSMALNEFIGNLFGTATPPSTLLIPYPIVLPIPLPIPIPLPYEAFLRAAATKPKNDGTNSRCSSTTNEDDANNTHVDQDHKRKSNDQPLDFTKEKIASRIQSDDESDDGDYRASNSEHEMECSTLLHHNSEPTKADTMKLKTHLQPLNKRPLTKESTSENNRPLRKRKRIIDCDYLRLRDSNSNESINPRKSI